eukprot:Hpha_TRINITY_DN4336_c0_g1::TRINITY_DN4336_c0_g1_i1::g.49991::m.49991/K21440/ANKRD50; ankyrin repeat domain-containing protein 50
MLRMSPYARMRWSRLRRLFSTAPAAAKGGNAAPLLACDAGSGGNETLKPANTEHATSVTPPTAVLERFRKALFELVSTRTKCIRKRQTLHIAAPSQGNDGVLRLSMPTVPRVITIWTTFLLRLLASAPVSIGASGAAQGMAEVNVLNDKSTHVNSMACAMAVTEGEVDVLRLLIDNGADVNGADEAGCTPCITAAGEGKTYMLRLLIDRGADVNKADNDGRTPCIAATARDKRAALKLLIERGADVNRADNKGRTPCITAVAGSRESRSTDTLRLLIENGADVNAADKEGHTPCYLAAMSGHAAALRFLMDHGANIDKACAQALKEGKKKLLRVLTEHGCAWAVRQGRADLLSWLLIRRRPKRTHSTLCIAAVAEGTADVLRVLIDNGANINKAGKGGCTPCIIAAAEGKADILRLLIDHGANVNKADKDGRTPCIAATTRGKVIALKLLIEQGADVNRADRRGRTPCTEAIMRGRKDILRLLLDHGADANRVGKGTPWYIAGSPCFLAAMRGDAVMLSLLKDNGADVDVSFALAVHKGAAVDVLRLLIQSGADVNKADKSGRTPCVKATAWGNAGALKLLIDHGVDVNKADRSGRTPCIEACRCRTVDMLKLLLDHGADVNKADESNGHTPCFVAVAGGRIEALKLLIDRGADIDKTTTAGVTPFVEAIRNVRREMPNSTHVLKLLIEHGAITDVLKLMNKHGADSLAWTKQNRGLRGLLRKHSKSPSLTPTSNDTDNTSQPPSKANSVITLSGPVEDKCAIWGGGGLTVARGIDCLL